MPVGSFGKKFFSVLTKGGCSHGIVVQLPIFRYLKNSSVGYGNQGEEQSKRNEVKSLAERTLV